MCLYGNGDGSYRGTFPQPCLLPSTPGFSRLTKQRDCSEPSTQQSASRKYRLLAGRPLCVDASVRGRIPLAWYGVERYLVRAGRTVPEVYMVQGSHQLGLGTTVAIGRWCTCTTRSRGRGGLAPVCTRSPLPPSHPGHGVFKQLTMSVPRPVGRVLHWGDSSRSLGRAKSWQQAGF